MMKEKQVGDVLEMQYINSDNKVKSVSIVVSQFAFPGFRFEVTK